VVRRRRRRRRHVHTTTFNWGFENDSLVDEDNVVTLSDGQHGRARAKTHPTDHVRPHGRRVLAGRFRLEFILLFA